MHQIIPAIITKDLKDLERQVSLVKDFVSKVQVDICDGVFTQSKTWPFTDEIIFEKITNEEIGLPFWEDVDYEAHLMVKEPEKYVDGLVKAGFSTVIFQVESDFNKDSLIEKLKSASIKIGASIKPETPNEKILELVENIDFIQIMGNDNLGEHGLSIQKEALEKVEFFRSKFQEMEISFDIGVNNKTIKDLFDLGVNNFVCGGYIFENENPVFSINNLKDIIKI